MVIIEGMDNSGKSTLAIKLAERLGYDVQESEGPPLSGPEIDGRIRRYAGMRRTVMVRHPCISNAIYGGFRPEGDVISPELREEFYQQNHLIIYCDPLDRGLGGHNVKAHDTPEHLAMLEARQVSILTLYREWAIRHAHLVYRIGDDMERICQMVHRAVKH